MDNYIWHKCADILPENCEYERTETAIQKDFVVYIDSDYDPVIAARCYDNKSGWYWEFGLNDPYPSDYADRITMWMAIELPD